MTDLHDILDDLRHDLGKYIALPLAFLPPDADDCAVRNAIRKGLLETRRKGDSVQSAQDLYIEFIAEVGHHLSGLPGWTELEDAIQTANAWLDVIDHETTPVVRAEAERDLSAVGQAIRNLEAQLSDE